MLTVPEHIIAINSMSNRFLYVYDNLKEIKSRIFFFAILISDFDCFNARISGTLPSIACNFAWMRLLRKLNNTITSWVSISRALGCNWLRFPEFSAGGMQDLGLILFHLVNMRQLSSNAVSSKCQDLLCRNETFMTFHLIIAFIDGHLWNLCQIFERSGHKSSLLPNDLDFPHLMQTDCEKGGAIECLFNKLKFDAWTAYRKPGSPSGTYCPKVHSLRPACESVNNCRAMIDCRWCQICALRASL
jgi:hypothetical protein